MTSARACVAPEINVRPTITSLMAFIVASLDGCGTCCPRGAVRYKSNENATRLGRASNRRINSIVYRRSATTDIERRLADRCFGAAQGEWPTCRRADFNRRAIHPNSKEDVFGTLEPRLFKFSHNRTKNAGALNLRHSPRRALERCCNGRRASTLP
jgi:hypothetical protein